MNQARKDTTGIKLEVNERLVLFSFFTLKLVIQILQSFTLLLNHIREQAFISSNYECV